MRAESKRRSRARGALAGALALLAACAAPEDTVPDLEAPGAAQASEEARVLAAFEQASNNHDLEALRELVSEDVVWFLHGVPVYRGRDEFLRPLAWDAATHASIELENLRFQGPLVQAEIIERNDFFRALEIEGLRQSVEFEIRGGRITALASLERSELGGDERTIERFLGWLARAHPDDQRRILQDAPDPAHAGELVELARAWVRAGRPD